MLLAYTAGRKVTGDDASGDGEDVESDEPTDELIEDWKVLRPDERDATPESERVYRWVKMSKSSYNVVTPDEMAEKYGADSLRLYGLFVAPFEDTVQWTNKGIEGANRFLNRVWRLWSDLRPFYRSDWRTETQPSAAEVSDAERALRRKLHQTIRKVGEDLESFRFNTCVAALMEFTNELSLFRNSLAQSKTTESQARLISEILEILPLIMSPMTPHMSDEIWERLGMPGSTYRQSWPIYDASAAAEDEITIVVQVNGKVRDRLVVPIGVSQEEIERLALACEKVVRELDSGKQLRKVIPVPGKLVNFVIA
jgi:leucyl-tRNA synthetase